MSLSGGRDGHHQVLQDRWLLVGSSAFGWGGPGAGAHGDTDVGHVHSSTGLVYFPVAIEASCS